MNSGLHTPHNDVVVSDAIRHFEYISHGIDRKVVIFPMMLKSVDGAVKYRYIQRTDDLLKVLEKINQGDDLYNLYITPNSFFRRERKKSALQKLNFLFVDIDNHSDSITHDDIRLLKFHLDDVYFNGKLPYPSMIVSSGRGLQLYWKIQSMSYNPNAIKFWNKIENGIINIMSDLDYNGFTIDKSVKDANRVLRLAGSLNHKSGTHAEILYLSDEIYTLTDISQGYIFGGLTSGKKYVRGKHKKNTKSKNNYRMFIPPGVEVGPLIGASLNKATVKYHESMRRKYSYKEIEILIKLRIRDLQKLMELRNGDFKANRQTFMLHYGNSLRQLLLSDDERARLMNDMNDKFYEPLSEGEIGHETSRKDVYNYDYIDITNDLAISNEEEQEMAVLRKDLQRLKKADEAAKNKEKRLLEHQQTLQKVQQLTDEGYSLPQISELLKVHPRTVSKYRKELGINLSKPSCKDNVLILKAQGLSQQEVAEALNVSIRTVRAHWYKESI